MMMNKLKGYCFKIEKQILDSLAALKGGINGYIIKLIGKMLFMEALK